MEKDERIKSIDYAKAIASFLVVLSHIRIDHMPQMENNALALFYIFFHNPTFYFASGYLFRFTMERYTKRRIIISKFCDTMVVYIIWGIAITVEHYIVLNDSGELGDSVLYAINSLWFFGVLFAGYIVVMVASLMKIERKLITLMWVGVSLFFMQISTVIGKASFFALIMWIGYNTKALTDRLLKWLVIFFLVVYSVMVCSGKYIIANIISSPGIEISLIYMVMLVSCSIIPKIAFRMSDKSIGGGVMTRNTVLCHI